MTDSRWHRRMATLAIVCMAFCWLLWEVSGSPEVFMMLLWGLSGVVFLGWMWAEGYWMKRKVDKVKRFKSRVDFGGNYNEDDWREDR
jgi:hypothetical protein